MSAPTTSQPFLNNIFDQTPDQQNFIGISLSRTDDLEGSADASFTINEIDEAYAAVVNAPPLPLFPGAADKVLTRWSILVDNISVNGRAVSLPPSTVQGAPAGKIAALLDTGTPNGVLPSTLLDAIYSQIPGSLYDNAWTIPCETTTIVAIEMGGQQFPIHPLDLSEIRTNQTTNITTCVSPFGAEPGGSEFDAIFGVSFMRNFYSV
ncbi:aspartic peptidase domain-containing protein [Mycena epipterygia]|nr:aspartic peptidase domain-containing protein [Mycena epipterygia]